MSQLNSRDIDLPQGGVVRLSGRRLQVFEALEACLRRNADATMHEVLAVLSVQIGRPAYPHAYSGRFTDLRGLGVIEAVPEPRDDVQSVANRAALGRAARVTAYRFPAMQKRLVCA